MVQSRQRRRLARNSLIVVLVLVGLYGVAGFVVLPWWLERNLPAQLEQQLGWQASVDNVGLNPFALTLDVQGVSASDSDGQKVLAFDDLFVNLSLLDLARGIIGFQDIRLTEPYVRLDLLKSNTLNLARDWQRAHPSAAGDTPAEAQASADSGPVHLLFQALTIDGGELLFRDLTGDQPAEFRITPLSLSLNDLATWPRDDDPSNYTLQAALGDQTLEWQGRLSVSPLASSGRLQLSNVGYQVLAHFLAPYLPYDLRGGSVTVRSDYRFSAGDRMHLATSNGELSLKDLAVALSPEAETPQLLTGSVSVDAVSVDLDQRRARVGQVTLRQLDLDVRRDEDGQINWLAPFAKADDGAPDAPEPDTSSDAGPFRWSVAGIEVAESRVRWQDALTPEPADLTLTDLSLTTGALTDALDESVDYSMSASLASGGTLSAKGQLTPAPFTLRAALSGSDIALAAFQPYVRQQANLAIADGTLAVDGDLDLDGQKTPLTGTFNGTAEVQRLAVRLPDADQPMLSWDRLRLSPIEYNVHPARLEIGSVALAGPNLNVIRNADGVHNLARVVPAGDAAPEDTKASTNGTADDKAQGESGADAPALIFRVGEVTLEQGSVHYTDRTLEPAFTTSLTNLKGAVTGISNIAPQKGSVHLTGTVGEVGDLTVDGALGTLGTDDGTTLTLVAKNLSLPALSPYLAQYLGYAVDNGKLNLNLDYRLNGTRIEASNQVVIDRLSLGRQVKSQQAVNAPVRLGLALLTNRQGVIDVNLPVSGDLSNPDFSVGGVVMRAFVNLLVKAAASPFTMLGSLADLAGLSGEDLGSVAFVPGSTELADGQAEKLAALAKALRKRPDLLLNVRGNVAPEADGLALLREDLSQGGQAPLSDDAWAKARDAYLNGERSLPPEALSNLARERGLALRKVMEETQGVPDDQLFLLESARDASVNDAGSVVVPFRLDVR